MQKMAVRISWQNSLKRESLEKEPHKDTIYFQSADTTSEEGTLMGLKISDHANEEP